MENKAENTALDFINETAKLLEAAHTGLGIVRSQVEDVYGDGEFSVAMDAARVALNQAATGLRKAVKLLPSKRTALGK